MGPLTFDTILRLQRLLQLLHSGLSACVIRQNVVSLRCAYVCMAQDALNVLIVYASFVQSGAESTTERMPAKPRAVDELRNFPPGGVAPGPLTRAFLCRGRSEAVAVAAFAGCQYTEDLREGPRRISLEHKAAIVAIRRGALGTTWHTFSCRSRSSSTIGASMDFRSCGH